MFNVNTKYLSCAISTLIIMSACARVTPEEETVPVSFDMTVDESELQADGSTKANTGDGAKVNTCIMEIYYGGVSLGQRIASIIDKKATFNVQLVASRTYDVAFWAEYREGNVGRYDTEDLRSVSFKDEYDYDEDSMDAFCARRIDFNVGQSSISTDVSLTRPLSMVTVSKPNTPGWIPTSITVSAPRTYNILTDELSNAATLTFTNPSFFFFAPDERQDIDFTVDGQLVNLVPTRRNYRTNIIIN